LRQSAEYVVIPLLALLVSGLLFSLLLSILGKSALDFFALIWRGGFGTVFSWQNTLIRAAPLILTGLCVAIPARIGLVVVGGEGALVISGFCAAAVAIPLIGVASPWTVTLIMLLTATTVGALSIGFVGWLRHARGVNETISSLLLTYIAVAIMRFFIEGALRDPADPNRPSTKSIGAGARCPLGPRYRRSACDRPVDLNEPHHLRICGGRNEAADGRCKASSETVPVVFYEHATVLVIDPRERPTMQPIGIRTVAGTNLNHDVASMPTMRRCQPMRLKKALA
jgi:hypothetical protein